MKNKYFCIVFLLISNQFYSFSQELKQVVVRGSIIDTSQAAMSNATVMLLSPKDSSLLYFARSDDQGKFVFKNVKNRDYQLKISFSGFIPISLKIGPFTELDNLFVPQKLKPITRELMEVVVKAARAPLVMKGDTIEYDARAFKVPEGSSVEDLLRRLPGMEVDAAGNIKAQGRDVKRLYVDGKSFFGDDPKLATKNLEAVAISKVQVFNEKSEQAKLTGVDDGKQEKAMNLELKEEFKKGKFGKIQAGGGQASSKQNLLELKGNYNRFNEKEQFSVIGFGNNINRSGLTWDEYGEYKGAASNSWDQEELGFSGSMIYYINGDEDGLRSNFDGRGFTNNKAIGGNYNYDTKKKKFNAGYYLKSNELDLPTIRNTRTFLQNGSFNQIDTSQALNNRLSHNLNGRFEQMFDSSNTLVVKATLKLRTISNNLDSRQLYTSDKEALSSRLNQNNDTENVSTGLNSVFIYNHKFKKNKKKNLTATGGYDFNNEDINDNYGYR